MKYYKLIDDPKRVWTSFEIGRIYPETFIANGRSLAYWLSDNISAHLMQEVSEDEYKLQEGILPEKWCVFPGNREEMEIVFNWARLQPDCNGGISKSETFDDWYFHDSVSFDYLGRYRMYEETKITFEQFKKYVLKEEVMSKQAQTFKITGSKSLLKAMWSDLLEIGYTETNYTPDNNYVGSSTYMATNATKTSNNTIKNYKELYCGDVGGQFHKTFNLPEQYTEALEFAKQQLDPSLWIPELKAGDYVVVLSDESYHYGNSNGAEKPIVGQTYQIKKFDYDSVCLYSEDNGWIAIQAKDLRLATPEEVKGHQSIKIRGYEADFSKEDVVQFGCQSFSKQTAKDLIKLIELGVIKSDYERQLRKVDEYFKK